MREENEVRTSGHSESAVKGWFVIYLRIYGILHILAGGYLLWEAPWLKLSAQEPVTLLLPVAVLLILLSGSAAVLVLSWGAYAVTALASVLTLTAAVLLPFLHHSWPSTDYVFPSQGLIASMALLEWVTAGMYLRFRSIVVKPAEEKEMTRERNPLVAALLSLLTPGLGQFYNGQARKGLVFYVSYFLLALLLFASLLRTFYGLIAFMSLVLCLYLLIMGEAVFSTLPRKKFTLKAYNRWYFYLLVVIFGAGINSFAGNIIKHNVWGVKAYTIVTDVMAPTLQRGDRVFADLKYYDSHRPRAGDVIVYGQPWPLKNDMIKRVFALETEIIDAARLAEPHVHAGEHEGHVHAGEHEGHVHAGEHEPHVHAGEHEGHVHAGEHEGHVHAGEHEGHVHAGEHEGHVHAGEHEGHVHAGEHDGHVHAGEHDGHVHAGEHEGHVHAGEHDGHVHAGSGALTVPDGTVFVVGDNRSRGIENRHWGLVEKHLIKGRVLYIYWSKNPKRIGRAIK